MRLYLVVILFNLTKKIMESSRFLILIFMIFSIALGGCTGESNIYSFPDRQIPIRLDQVESEKFESVLGGSGKVPELIVFIPEYSDVVEGKGIVIPYINNQISVYINEGVEINEIKSLFESVGAIIASKLTDNTHFRITFSPALSSNELDLVINILEESDIVDFASKSYAVNDIL